ncbi:hypothetical protein Ga0074812_14916 [Parafrankia irregularis]|uniref:Uncharacterized protein n=1 Tax=Parafrankia irregularis TaxID=795642 RepID=A0A0S4R1E9_9ACTN|nr:MULTISPECIES: hypothetical protein [Frankiaceae]KPM50300.1 hypothetical protein ACG83_40885 [Frankia sp. R43]MBE3204723.1 MarR family transcriptional regulator [Parafrankia sp. CH37]CUU60872.1 hypothetical protein Ga0074812_14916 [Parafrankia irregularis]
MVDENESADADIARVLEILRNHQGPATLAEIRVAAGMMVGQLRPVLDRMVDTGQLMTSRRAGVRGQPSQWALIPTPGDAPAPDVTTPTGPPADTDTPADGDTQDDGGRPLITETGAAPDTSLDLETAPDLETVAPSDAVSAPSAAPTGHAQAADAEVIVERPAEAERETAPVRAGDTAEDPAASAGAADTATATTQEGLAAEGEADPPSQEPPATPPTDIDGVISAEAGTETPPDVPSVHPPVQNPPAGAGEDLAAVSPTPTEAARGSETGADPTTPPSPFVEATSGEGTATAPGDGPTPSAPAPDPTPAPVPVPAGVQAGGAGCAAWSCPAAHCPVRAGVAPPPRPARRRAPKPPAAVAKRTTNADGQPRLQAGALTAMVRTVLATNADVAMSVTELSREIPDRSSGAINASCDAMTGRGEVRLVPGRPKRFQITPAGLALAAGAGT